MFVCIINGANPSKGYPENELKGKHVHQILEMLSLSQSSFHINYVCPLYQVRLEPKDVPLKKYPDILIKGKPDPYPPPPTYLRIIEHDNPDDLFQQADVIFNFNVKTQIETTFPPLPVPFKDNELKSLKISDVIERCKTIFEYGIEPDTPLTLSTNDKIINEKDSFKSYAKDSYKKPLTFSCTVNAKAKKKIEFRIISATEITQNESKYIKQVSYLLEHWKPALEREKLFEENDLKLLFRDVPLILNSHCVFLQSLEKDPISFASEFGSKFLSFVQFFKIAATYVSQFEQIEKMYNEKCKNRVFSAKMAEIEDQIQPKILLNFISNYIIPVQHYPRYKTLLMELNKLTPNFHSDKQYILRAIEVTDTVVQQFDHSTNRMKQLEAVNDLQNEIGKTVVLSKPGRNLITRTTIRFSHPKAATGDIFMFNDLVVITAIKKQKHTPVLTIPMNQFRFVNGKPSSEAIFFFANDKEYAIHFTDPQEKQKVLIPAYLSWGKFFDIISLKTYFIKWVDISISKQLPSLMNFDGCTIQNCALFFGGTNQYLIETNQLVQFKFISESNELDRKQSFYKPPAAPENNRQKMACSRHGSFSGIRPHQDLLSTSNYTKAIYKGEWSVQDTPVPKREHHTVVSIGDRMYVFFGCTKRTTYNDIWMYDFNSKEWEELKPKDGSTIEGRYGHSSILWQDKIVIFGGKANSGKLLNTILIFDTTTNEFINDNIEITGDIPTPCYLHSASFIKWNESMIVIGGRSDKGLLNDIRILDLNSMKWTKLSQINIPSRINHRSFALENGRFVAVVGGTSDQAASKVIIIDTQQGTSDCAEQFGNIPFGLSNYAATSINNENVKFITFGGIDSFSKLPFASSYILDTSGGIREVYQRNETTVKNMIPAKNDLTPHENYFQEILKMKSNEDENEIIIPQEIQQEIPIPQTSGEITESTESQEIAAEEAPAPEIISPGNEEKQEESEKKEVFAHQTKKILSIPLPNNAHNRRGTFEKKVFPVVDPSIRPVKTRRKSEAPPVPTKIMTKGLSSQANSDTEAKRSESESEVVNQNPPEVPRPTPVRSLSVPVKNMNMLQTELSDNENAEQSFAKELGIDMSGLNEISKHMVTIKLQKLINMKKKNEEIEKDISKYESMQTGNADVPPDFQFTVKLFSNEGKTVNVFKTTANSTQADILSIITSLLNRDNIDASVLIEPSHTETLTDESLKEAYKSVYSSKLRTLDITVV